MTRVEIIKVYDEKGRTVLKRSILDHMGVRKGDLILADLRDNGTVLLRPFRKEYSLARLEKVEDEEKVLEKRAKIRYNLY